MARVTRLYVEGFRSVHEPIELVFPPGIPVVLVGENNAGKSNIIRALDLVLGEWWPGSHQPEDHEFWSRDPANGPIKIRASFSGMTGYDQSVDALSWQTTDDGDPDFGCLLEDGQTRWVKKEMRDQCMCFSVGADRRLPYQLSYTSKFTFLSKLMRRFHSVLTEDASRVQRLKSKFGEIRSIFDEVTAFGSFQTELTSQFGEMFGGMSYGLQVDFSAYDPSNFFHSLRIQAVENRAVRSLEELGTGQEQLLALAFAHAYAKAFYGGILLAFEEPEAHLHPLAQEWLAKKIRQMCSDGLQLVLTTHSPAFVDFLGLNGCVLVRKNEGATTIRQLTKQDLADHCIRYGSHATRTQADTILPFYEGSATQAIKAGLFAKRILLVEGLTESLSLPVYLAKAGLDVTKEGIAVIPVMGKGNLAKWWRFFTAYEIPTYVIFDNDDHDDVEAEKRKDALKAMGIPEDRIQTTIQLDSWTVTPTHAVYGHDFEGSMRASFSTYEEVERLAKEHLGDSKPLIARFVADRLTKDDTQPGWQKITELSQALQNLVLPTLPQQTEAADELPF